MVAQKHLKKTAYSHTHRAGQGTVNVNSNEWNCVDWFHPSPIIHIGKTHESVCMCICADWLAACLYAKQNQKRIKPIQALYQVRTAQIFSWKNWKKVSWRTASTMCWRNTSCDLKMDKCIDVYFLRKIVDSRKLHERPRHWIRSRLGNNPPEAFYDWISL